MSDKKNKYYVLWVGESKGIFEKYDELQVEAYRLKNEGIRPILKGFMSRAMAEEAFNDNMPSRYIGHNPFFKWKCNLTDGYFLDNVSEECMYVDSIIKDHDKIQVRGFSHAYPQFNFHQNFVGESENIAKYLAVFTSLLYQHKHEFTLPIYCSSSVALTWIKNNKVNRDSLSGLSPELYKLVMQAQRWIGVHGIKCDLLLWKSKKWGQIPASFKENGTFKINQYNT